MHNIVTVSYPASMSRSEIMSKVDEYVRSHGSGWGTDCVRFLDEPIQDNESAAQEVLKSNADNHYGGYAVRYYNTSGVSTAQTKVIDIKIQKTIDKKAEWVLAHSIHNLKANLITCVKCGSKLNKSYIKGEKCPLCYADLRSKSVLERIKGFDDKIALLRKEKGEICKPKAAVMWLVWFEYNS